MLPSTTGQSGNPGHAARKAARLVATELEARGARVLRAAESRRLFEQRGSAPPIAVNASDVDALARDAQQALYHVASGLYSRAQRDVERAMGRARKALESLNREARAARHLLDACMFLVRGHLERGERQAARRQALDCRRLVPDIEPDTTVHPPNVIGVLAEAEADLLSREPSSLRIESVPAGCAALVNGRNLGTTPKELGRLPAGEYRVQVECNDGEPGRVHRAILNGNRTVVRVDTSFDRVVQTAFDLSLRYDSSAQERTRRTADALEAARVVGASELVVTSLIDDRGGREALVAVNRYRVVDGALLAESDLTLDIEGKTAEGALAAVARALLEPLAPGVALTAQASRSGTEPPKIATVPDATLVGATSAPPPIAPEQTSVADDDPDDLRTASMLAAGAGAAANLTGWILYVHHATLQDEYVSAVAQQSPDRFEAYRRVEDFDLVPKLTAGAGAGVLALSLPLWLPDEPGVPWWAWTGGGAGLLAAGAGALLTIQAGDCLVDDFGRCTEPELATGIGPMLLLQSAPLIALPIVYGVRAMTGGRVSGQVSFARDGRGALFTLAGAL